MRGWNHDPRHLIGNVLRNTATALTLLAERVDPQPDVVIHPFTIRTPTGTTTAEAHITWHSGKFHETA
jgi:hypothetical protein